MNEEDRRITKRLGGEIDFLISPEYREIARESVLQSVYRLKAIRAKWEAAYFARDTNVNGETPQNLNGALFHTIRQAYFATAANECIAAAIAEVKKLMNSNPLLNELGQLVLDGVVPSLYKAPDYCTE